jgi:hypothetical protein
MIAGAVRAHRSFLSTAPFVNLHVGGVEIGQTVSLKQRGASATSVRAEIEVQAAPWVSVSKVTLIVNGKDWKVWTVPESKDAVRFHESIDVPISTDSFVLARVDGDKPLSPVVGDEKRFDVRPFALTNPVFVDSDGNGVYDAPLKGK